MSRMPAAASLGLPLTLPRSRALETQEMKDRRRTRTGAPEWCHLGSPHLLTTLGVEMATMRWVTFVGTLKQRLTLAPQLKL